MPTLSEILNQRRSPTMGTSLTQQPDSNPEQDLIQSMKTLSKQVGGFGLSAVGALGNALDLPGSMVRDVVAGKNPLDQILTPFSDENRITGRQLLEKMGARRNRETGLGGWTDPKEAALDLGGFGLEIILDPWGPIGTAMKFPSISRMAGMSGRLSNKAIRKVMPYGDKVMDAVGKKTAELAAVGKRYFHPPVLGAKTMERQESFANNVFPEIIQAEDDARTLLVGSLDQLAQRGADLDDPSQWGQFVRYVEGVEDQYKDPLKIFKGDIVDAGDGVSRPVQDILTNSKGETLARTDIGEFPVSALNKVAPNPDMKFLDPKFHDIGDLWKTKLEEVRQLRASVGQKAPLIGDEADIDFFPRQMKDFLKYLIYQEDGTFRNSSAMRQFEKHPELFRDFVLTGNRGGTAATEALLKDQEWNEIVDAARKVVDDDILVKDGNAYAAGHATVRHVERFAKKLDMDPEDLWEELGFSRTRPWAPVQDVEVALTRYRDEANKAARLSPNEKVRIARKGGASLFENLGDPNLIRKVKIDGNTQKWDLPDWAELTSYDLKDKATYDHLKTLHQNEPEILKRIDELRMNGQQLFSWYEDAEDGWEPVERFFTPLFESKLNSGWTANLKGFRKSVDDLPAGDVEIASMGIKNRIREKYGHELIREMPKIDDSTGYANFVFINPKTGVKRLVPIQEYNDAKATYEMAQQMGVPVSPSNVYAKQMAGDLVQNMEDRYAAMADLLTARANVRDFGIFGNNPIVNAFDTVSGHLKGVALDKEFRRMVVEHVMKQAQLDDAGNVILGARRVPKGGAIQGSVIKDIMSSVEARGQDDLMRAGTNNVESLLSVRQKTLNREKFLQLVRRDLESQGLKFTDDPEAATNIRKYLLDTPLSPDQTTDLRNLFAFFESPPEVHDLLKFFDSSMTVLKGNLLATFSTVFRNMMSGTVQSVITGDTPITPGGLKSLKDGLLLAAGKHVDAPDTKDLRTLATQLGLNPDSSAARSQAFVYKFMGAMNRQRLHSQMDLIDDAALASSGTASRVLQTMPKGVLDHVQSLKEFWRSQPVIQHFNPYNLPGVLKHDKTLGRKVQRSTEHLGSYITGNMQTFGDNAIRMSGVLNRMRQYGETFDQAFAKVQWNQVSYDPRRYTRFERQVMKRLIPFYSFMSRSLKLVALDLATNPGGGLGRTIRAQRTAVAGEDQYVPYDVQDSAAIPLGQADDGSVKYLTSLGLMHEDAIRYLAPVQGVRGILQQLVGSSNPMFKGIVEYATNTSTFFESPMGGRRLDDLDPKMGRIVFNIRNLAADAGIGQHVPLPPSGRPDPVPGKVAEAIAANSPLASYFRYLHVATDPRRSAKDKLVNLLTGVRTKQYSSEAMIRELRDRLNAIELEMGARPVTLVTGSKRVKEELEAQGYTEEAARLEAVQKWLQRLRDQTKKKREMK